MQGRAEWAVVLIANGLSLLEMCGVFFALPEPNDLFNHSNTGIIVSNHSQDKFNCRMHVLLHHQNVLRNVHASKWNVISVEFFFPPVNEMYGGKNSEAARIR